MKKVGFILSVIFLISAVQCTTTRSIPVEFNCSLLDYPVKDFKTDLFGNIYTIDLKNRLKVYDRDLNLLFEYYNNILGEISYIDVTNPKKIALFFSGFQKVIFVDDTLAEIGRYEGEFNVLAMGTSRDNNIWIYDGVDYRLKKIASDNKLLVESNPVESHHELDIIPDYIIEQDNMVYIVEEGKGAAVFDNFGTYSTYIPLEASSLSMDKGSMIFVRDSQLVQRSLSNSFADDRILKTVPAGAETAYIFKKTIYYLDNGCLSKDELD